MTIWYRQTNYEAKTIDFTGFFAVFARDGGLCQRLREDVGKAGEKEKKRVGFAMKIGAVFCREMWLLTKEKKRCGKFFGQGA